MSRSKELRAIDYFISTYNNAVDDPEKIRRISGIDQDAPDAICQTNSGRKISLEHTSAYRPKGVYWKRGNKAIYEDLNPVLRILDRKFKNHYGTDKTDETWLLMQPRRTFSISAVENALKDLEVPSQFDRVFIQWPISLDSETTQMGILELPTRELLIPALLNAA